VMVSLFEAADSPRCFRNVGVNLTVGWMAVIEVLFIGMGNGLVGFRSDHFTS